MQRTKLDLNPLNVASTEADIGTGTNTGTGNSTGFGTGTGIRAVVVVAEAQNGLLVKFKS